MQVTVNLQTINQQPMKPKVPSISPRFERFNILLTLSETLSGYLVMVLDLAGIVPESGLEN